MFPTKALSSLRKIINSELQHLVFFVDLWEIQNITFNNMK